MSSLTNTSRRTGYRPNSASKRMYNPIKTNTSLDVPPPIVFTMPNNRKKLSGMGNKMEREELYENNMQLKEKINMLKKELAETRNQLVKKELENRKKERIIKECSKENDLESVHQMNLEKAKESTLVSLCRDKYNELKKKHIKLNEENAILKANIKITKLKEYQIQIDVLKKEMGKIRSLYLHILEKNNRLNEEMSEFQNLKDKYLEQHNIINGFVKKCEQYNNDINYLKEENDSLRSKLEINIRKQTQLKNKNIKLKITNKKICTSKKMKENYDLFMNDNKKLISDLKKDLNEYKRLYDLKDKECKKLIEHNDKLKNTELKRKNERPILQPFNYNQLKVIENKKEDKTTNKISLYKSLIDEYRHKIKIYESYLKSNGIDKEKLLQNYEYTPISSNTKKNEEMSNNIKESNNNEGEENNNMNSNNNLASMESNANNNNINNNNLLNSENNEGINKEETINNINNVNNQNNNDPNSINVINNNVSSNYSTTNANTINNLNKLQSIEEEKQEEGQYSDESQLLSLLHVFVKNLEAQGITKEQINQRIEEICKLFENKEEATKEEFIEPFVKMFIETMKITQEKDKEIIVTFLSDFVDSLNGETVVFFNGLIEVFDNIKDYKGINKDREVSFGLNKYKTQLIDVLKKNDENNTNLITFDIFRKIVQDLNIILEDESMEYLIYKMKKNVPPNNSIFDLNYEVMIDLMETNEIGDIFINIKNALKDNNTNLDKECQDYINTVDFQEIKFLIIKKDNFFSVLDKLKIAISDELKNIIFELFKIEIETDKNEQQYWMEYDRLKGELE